MVIGPSKNKKWLLLIGPCGNSATINLRRIEENSRSLVGFFLKQSAVPPLPGRSETKTSQEIRKKREKKEGEKGRKIKKVLENFCFFKISDF